VLEDDGDLDARALGLGLAGAADADADAVEFSVPVAVDLGLDEDGLLDRVVEREHRLGHPALQVEPGRWRPLLPGRRGGGQQQGDESRGRDGERPLWKTW
jgi:hypothetical protein